VDLGGTKIYAALNDLAGTTLVEASAASQPSPGEAESSSLDRLLDLIDRLATYPRLEGQALLGIGVGAPGVTLSAEGIVTLAPSLGWKDLPLGPLLRERFNLPALIENDVNLAALGEYGFGAARGAASLVCVAVGTGIGGGIVLNGKLHRGHRASAAEIGIRYDAFGALEQLASGPGIAARARQLVGHSISTEDVFHAARRGLIWAEQIVRETVDYLTLAVANIAAILDPEVVVLSGGVMAAADQLADPIRRRLEGLIPSVPTIVVSTLGPRATALGATLLMAETLLGPEVAEQIIRLPR
jgi:predicted NBD/HSP70 family sugar kinase